MIKTFTLNNQYDPTEYEGFVYRITELATGRFYIGKKNFFSKVSVKGKKNKVKKQSNWLSYCSSSKELAPKIKAFPDGYKFTILYLCKDASILNYQEVKTMMEYGCMTDPLSYNNNCRITLLTKLKDAENRITKL